MAFSIAQALPWNPGEEAMHRLTRVPEHDNPTTPFLTPRAAHMIQRYPVMALGTLDAQGRPWATVWGNGETPVAQAVAPSVIGIRGMVDASYDPVVKELYGGRDDGEVVKEPEDKAGRMVSGLSIHLEERGRVKLAGRMVAGALSAVDLGREPDDIHKQGRAGNAQLVVKIEQSLGNCPKYLNSKKITPVRPEEFTPRLISDSPYLSSEAVDLINRADLFFISSANDDHDMDINHRGGSPGFVRIEHNSPSEGDGAVLVYPEYSGNNLYQTLGNLKVSPRAGIVIPDFVSGTVLYLTGTTEILFGKDAQAVMPRAKMCVRFRVTASRLVEKSLPVRGRDTVSKHGGPGGQSTTGASPYNPRIFYLANEDKGPSSTSQAAAEIKATLLSNTRLTPTINRYRFALSDPTTLPPWRPGQYVALDFSSELDMGYSHSRDDDPQSLNDDYIRTFTVSSRHGYQAGLHNEEFEVTVRNMSGDKNSISGGGSAGAVTSWLARQRVDRGVKVEVGVKAFAGDFVVKQHEATLTQQEQQQHEDTAAKITPFIAGGIGITPVLPQVQDLDLSRFRLFWTLGLKDVGLVADVLERYPELAAVTDLFLTGALDNLNQQEKEMLELVQKQARRCLLRRLKKEDLLELVDESPGIEDWYLCAAPGLRASVQQWLPGKQVIYENFDY